MAQVRGERSRPRQKAAAGIGSANQLAIARSGSKGQIALQDSHIGATVVTIGGHVGCVGLGCGGEGAAHAVVGLARRNGGLGRGAAAVGDVALGFGLTEGVFPSAATVDGLSVEVSEDLKVLHG